MTTATIRQIQHNLAKVLRCVEAGEEVEIRRRNQPIARIIPVYAGTEREVDWSSLNQWRNRVFASGKLSGKSMSDLLSESRGDR